MPIVHELTATPKLTLQQQPTGEVVPSESLSAAEREKRGWLRTHCQALSLTFRGRLIRNSEQQPQMSSQSRRIIVLNTFNCICNAGTERKTISKHGGKAHVRVFRV